MPTYITHYFAHVETLERAERWLLQLGFEPCQIEVHREGTPWLSVLVTPDKREEAAMVLQAAERSDPDGWPSFWDMARMPHPHAEPAPEDLTGTSVVTARPSPVGWHPPERADTDAVGEGLGKVWDVTTRFL